VWRESVTRHVSSERIASADDYPLEGHLANTMMQAYAREWKQKGFKPQSKFEAPWTLHFETNVQSIIESHRRLSAADRMPEMNLACIETF